MCVKFGGLFSGFVKTKSMTGYAAFVTLLTLLYMFHIIAGNLCYFALPNKSVE